MIEVNPCNCSTCNKDREYQIFANDCPFNGWDYTRMQVEMMTYRCGCLSHPLALKVASEPVVKTLTTMMDACDKYDSHGRGMRDGYDHAISLLEYESINKDEDEE